MLTFNAKNTSNINWFADANLQSSPWQDINTITDKNYFSLASGFCGITGCRDFHINYHYGGCPADTGWLTIGNIPNGCDWEKKRAMTSFLYSKKTTAVNWNNGEFILLVIIKEILSATQKTLDLA